MNKKGKSISDIPSHAVHPNRGLIRDSDLGCIFLTVEI